MALKAVLILLAVCCTASAVSAEPGRELVLQRRAADDGEDRFEFRGLTQDERATLAQEPSKLAESLEVFVAGDTGKARTALFGTHALEDGRLVFRPRFPLRGGLTYRAVAKLSDETLERDFEIPVKPLGPVGQVAAVYPSLDVLPENQLKFYLHFSTPMSRGEAYRRIHLFKEGVGEIEYPFLELGEELWDPDGKRFTLFFDPGRVKRELKPREEVGPALEEGGKYRLVIDRSWPDAAGRPLAQSFTKTFRVGPADYRQPRPAEWVLITPRASSTEPLVVQLDEPLDHAMLHRVIELYDAKGELVAGAIEVESHESKWSFSPKDPWTSGNYSLVVQTNIEDLAGNSIGRPFEVDLFRSVSGSVQREFVKLLIEVR